MSKAKSLVGVTLRGYYLSQELATNSVSTIYAANHVASAQPHKEYAITCFHTVRLTSVQEQERFLQEAQIQQNVRHPSILPLLLYGIEDGTPYIGTDIGAYSFKSLEKRIQHRQFQPFEQSEALAIILQIGQALHYAHQHGVVHGDLHPRNVLFTTGEKLIVANFRFSSLAQVAGMAYPSSAYQAPEQRWGGLDARSDQFSLSWLAYTLLTGYRPVLTSLSNSESSHTPASTQSRVAARDYDLALPAYLEEALLRARAEEPQLRYPTILAFLRALRLEPADGMNAPVFPEGEGSERGEDHLARRHVSPSPASSADTHLQMLEVAQPSDQKAMLPVASAIRSSVATVSKQEMSRRTNDTGPLIPAQAKGANPDGGAAGTRERFPAEKDETHIETAEHTTFQARSGESARDQGMGDRMNTPPIWSGNAAIAARRDLLTPQPGAQQPATPAPLVSSQAGQFNSAALRGQLWQARPVPLAPPFSAQKYRGRASILVPDKKAARETPVPPSLAQRERTERKPVSPRSARLTRTKRLFFCAIGLIAMLLIVGSVSFALSLLSFNQGSTQTRLRAVSSATSALPSSGGTPALVTPQTGISATADPHASLPTAIPTASHAGPVLATPSTTGAGVTPAPTPTPTSRPPAVYTRFSYTFDDGSTDGWSGISSAVRVSTAMGWNSLASLQVSFNTPTAVDNPYIYVTGPNPPLMVAGQTISVYIYLPDNSTGISADFSLQSQRSSWYDSATTPLTAGRWNRLTYMVPSLDAPVSTLGIDLYCSSNMGKLSLYVDDISVN